ncbi:MAG: TonB-dependent receptor [Bacteroidetes bacterium]|nr:TonB-dependent receptor [Bacteroidota bacterium]
MHNFNQYVIRTERIGYKPTEIVLSDKVLKSKQKHILHIYSLPIQTGSIIVKGEHDDYLFDESISPKIVLRGKELQRDLSSTLASTLKNELGVSMRAMGPAPSRPVLRGLGGDRIVISEDGIKNDDLSSTSPDHAVTIEPFSVDRIEIIRGPKILLRTGMANGGVIQLVRDEIPLKLISRFTGNAGLYFESANKGFLGSSTFSLPINKFIFRGEFSKKNAGNISSPIGELKNTSFDVLNGSLASSFVDENFAIGANIKVYETRYGIPGGFVGAHPNGVDIEISKLQNQIKGILKVNNNFISELNFHVNQLHLRQKEFEKKGFIGADFLVNHLTFGVDASHKEFLNFNNGNFAISLEERDYRVGGFVFTPTTKLQNFSAAIFESWKEDDFAIQFGIRNEIASITPSENKYLGNDILDLNKKRNFWITSGALSLLYHFEEFSHFGFTINKSSRIPTIEELFSKGPHLAAYSFEVGNPDLSEEKSIGSELFYHFEKDNFSILVNGFYNYFFDFITPRNTGQTNWATLLPIYQTSLAAAEFKGIELEIKKDIFNNFNSNFTLSYTDGSFAKTKKPLPAIPPLKIFLGFDYKYSDFTIGFTREFTDKQNKVDEFELPTEKYAISNLYFQYSFLNDLQLYNFTFSVENIFNKTYYNHLSRIKSILPESGRNIKFILRMYF